MSGPVTLNDVITEGLRSAPELYQSPGAATAAGQAAYNAGLNTSQTFQAMAHAANLQALQQTQEQAVKKTSHHWWDGALKTVYGVGHAINKATFGAAGEVIGDVSNTLNIGLQEVQHQYRYLHDVEARHGWFTALAEGIPIAGATLAGGLLGGPQAGILAGETVAGIEGRIAFTDSWKRTGPDASASDHAQSIYNRQTDQYSGGSVSLGRDLTHAVGLHKNALLSGVVDGVFDLAADPLQNAGTLGKEIHAAQFVVQGPEDLGRAMATSGFQNEAARIAATSDPLAIVTSHPGLAPVAKELAAANSVQDVHDIMYGAYAKQLAMGTGVSSVPHSNFISAAVTDAKRAAADYSGPGSRFTHPFTSYNAASIDYTAAERLEQGKYALSDPRNAVEIEKYFKSVLPWRKLTFTHDPLTLEQLASPVELHAKDLAHDVGLAVLDPATPIGTKMNIIDNTLKAVATDVGDLSPREVEKLAGTMRPAIGHAMAAGTKGFYGYGRDGEDLSEHAFTLQGQEGTAREAIWGNQQGHIILPNPIELRRALIDAGPLRKAAWGADDFWYNHVTSNFKRLALATGATAARIGLSETVLAGNLDPVGFAKSAIAAGPIKRKMFEGLSAEEADAAATEGLHLFSRAKGLLTAPFSKTQDASDALRLAITKDSDMAYVATKLAEDTNGTRIANGLVGSRDMLPAEVGVNKQQAWLASFIQGISRKDMEGAFAGIGNQSEDHVNAWFNQVLGLRSQETAKIGSQSFLEELAKKGTHDEAWFENTALPKVRDAIHEHLKQLDPQELSGMGRVMGDLADGTVGVSQEKIAQLADTQARALAGLTFAPKDSAEQVVAHESILSALATGDKITGKMLEDVPENLRPLTVPGRNMIHLPIGNPIEAVSNFGWNHVMDPMIEAISRDPEYLRRTTAEFKRLRTISENFGLNMSDEEILRHAKPNAAIAMQPFIHNPTERSVFAQMARNFMPFYYAQEQAFKRVGRLAIQDPGALRRFQMGAHAVANIGHVETDENGQQHMVYPGLGFLDQGVVKVLGGLGIPVAGSLPVAIGMQVKSLATVFPGSEGLAPGFGPLVSIPVKAFENFDPAAAPVARGILGDVGESQGIWDQIIPNSTFRRTYQALGSEHTKAFQSSMMYTVQAMMYHDQSSKKVQAWTAAREKFLNGQGPDPGLENYPGLVPPSDAGPMTQQKFIDRVKNQTRINFLFKAAVGMWAPATPTLEVGDFKLRDEYQQLIQKKGFADAQVAFLKKHPDATAYTVFQTKTNNGEFIDSKLPAQDWIDKNEAFIHKYPYAAAWLIPQGGGKDPFSQSVYNEQLAQHLRVRKTPEQFLNDVYTAQGNSIFYNVSKPAYDAALAEAQAQGDKTREGELRSSFSNYILQYGKQNPVWWDNFTSEDRKHRRELAVDQLNQIFAAGNAPEGKQTDDVRGLLKDYEAYRQGQLFARSQYGSNGKDILDQSWQTHMDEVKKQHPNLVPIIDRIFRVEV